eukprot:952586-Rhodomonas_salina.1
MPVSPGRRRPLLSPHSPAPVGCGHVSRCCQLPCAGPAGAGSLCLPPGQPSAAALDAMQTNGAFPSHMSAAQRSLLVRERALPVVSDGAMVRWSDGLTVVEHVGDCALASHALAAVAGTDSSETHRAPAGYVREAFDGYAATYDASMSTLAFRAPEMLNGALEDVMAALAESEERGASAGDAEVRWKKLDKGLDLGCGTGWMGPLVGDKVRWLLGVDLSSRMLDVVGQQRSGVYDALSTADLVDALEKEEAASVGLVVAADALPYFGDLRPVLDRAAA